MSEKKIPFLTNEVEIAALKNVFASNEDLLTSIRSLLLGFPITKTQQDVIRSVFSDKIVLSAFKKKIFTELASDSMIGQGGDYWFGTDTEIVGKDPQTIRQIVESKSNVLNMLKEAVTVLENPTSLTFDLNFTFDEELFGKDPFMIDLIARNKYINSINTGLMMVKVIAGQKTETVEEAKKRLSSDSAK